MNERAERVAAAHADIIEMAKLIKPTKALDKAREALYQAGRPAGQRTDGTRPSRGRSGSSALPAVDDLARAIMAAERDIQNGIADAQLGMRKATRAAALLDQLCEDTPYYADGAWRCPGFERVPHKTADRFVNGYCKKCDGKRSYREKQARRTALSVSDS